MAKVLSLFVRIQNFSVIFERMNMNEVMIIILKLVSKRLSYTIKGEKLIKAAGYSD